MTALQIQKAEVAMSAFEAIFAKYIWIWIGLTVGLAAKYALLIKRGVRIRMQLVLADALLLPLVALISFSIISRLGADEEMAAMVTAICTVGADRLVKLVTERFLQNVETEIDTVTQRAIGQVRQQVQTELSGQSIIQDTLTGTAPETYTTLQRVSPIAPLYPPREDV